MNRKDSKCQKLKPKFKNKNYNTTGNELFFPKNGQKCPKMTKINFFKNKQINNCTTERGASSPLYKITSFKHIS